MFNKNWKMTESKDTNGNAEVNATDIEKKIIKQVEFYFGDRNYSKDKFLKEKAEEDDGWVTLECLTTFNRLRSLSSDTDVIATALRKSLTGLVEVSEDDKKVRRLKSKPLPEDSVEARQEAKARTVYCKGFPLDATIDQLEEFFADKGKVVWIAMQRYKKEGEEERLFKGSAFVEFASVDDAKAFVAMESVKYNEQELIKMTKDDYFKSKTERIKAKRQEQKQEEKKSGEETKEGEEEETEESTTEEEVKKEPKEDENEKKEEGNEEKPLTYVKGCVLHFKNVGEQTSREDLKALFGEQEDIAWVDFARGAEEGFIRFSKEGAAQRVVEALKAKNDGKVVIRDVETTLRVLEGEEEKQFWIKTHQEIEKAREKQKSRGPKQRGGQGGRGFRGGRGRGRGRGGKRSFERPPKKEGNEEVTSKNAHTQLDEGEPTEKKIKIEAADD